MIGPHGPCFGSAGPCRSASPVGAGSHALRSMHVRIGSSAHACPLSAPTRQGTGLACVALERSLSTPSPHHHPCLLAPYPSVFNSPHERGPFLQLGLLGRAASEAGGGPSDEQDLAASHKHAPQHSTPQPRVRHLVFLASVGDFPSDRSSQLWHRCDNDMHRAPWSVCHSYSVSRQARDARGGDMQSPRPCTPGMVWRHVLGGRCMILWRRSGRCLQLAPGTVQASGLACRAFA